MTERIAIGKSDEFPLGKLRKIDIDEDTTLAVARLENGLCAVNNTCPHMGGPLGNGTLEDGNVICPWHNSKFDLCSGKNIEWAPGVLGLRMPSWARRLISLGKPSQPVKNFTIIEENGEVFVQLD